MSRTVVSVRGLGKRYRLGATVASAAARLAGRREPHARGGEDFWALRGVAFDVREGEVLGVIGANGAGKSTLLKILTGITEPTEGDVRTRGRIASLLEIGTGFHPELTGRENVYMNGALLGMRRGEIRAKFDEIVAFAGVETFLDTPVKRYSNGMRVRLGFAVAAHLEPEILLIDEVLAVGDAAFQQKCLGKMDEVAEHGRTVLFVSHNLAALESLCPTALLLEAGRLVEAGPTVETIGRYLGGIAETLRERGGAPGRYVAQAGAPGPVRGVSLGPAPDAPGDLLRVGEPCSIRIQLVEAPHLLTLGLHIKNDLGQRVTSFSTRYHPGPAIPPAGPVALQCDCPELMLAPGRYTLEVTVATGGQVAAHLDPCLAFRIVEADVLGTGKVPPPRDGVCISRATWTLLPA